MQCPSVRLVGLALESREARAYIEEMGVPYLRLQVNAIYYDLPRQGRSNEMPASSSDTISSTYSPAYRSCVIDRYEVIN